MGPRTGLNAMAKKKIPLYHPCRESNHGRSSCCLVIMFTEQAWFLT